MTGSGDVPAHDVQHTTSNDTLEAVQEFLIPNTPAAGDLLVAQSATETEWQAPAVAGVVPAMPAANIFTASGTYTVPAGVSLVEIECLAGGGGGGGGGSAALTGGISNQTGGGGGGSGATVRRIAAVTAGQVLTVTVGQGGAGGTGGAASTGTTGNTGTIGARGGASGVTGSQGTLCYAFGGGWGDPSGANSNALAGGGVRSTSYSAAATVLPTGYLGCGAPSNGYAYMSDNGCGGGGGGGTATATLGGGAGKVLTALSASSTAAITASTTVNGVNGVTATLYGCGGGGGGGGAPGGSGGNGGAGAPGYVTIRPVG